MDRNNNFFFEYEKEAQHLLEKNQISDPDFSRGTYQFEVRDKKKAFPFIQIRDDGSVGDYFCSCKLSESGHGCPHLAAAYLKVFNGHLEPLHVRFRKSFWNRLFQMAAKRHGYHVDVLQKQEDGTYLIESKTAKELFYIRPHLSLMQNELLKLIEDRPVETEETSIKFSNLSTDEIAKYKAGKAGHLLNYELSFWSDLAKWIMILTEKSPDYEIIFEGESLPHGVKINFKGLTIWFYISDVNWPWLIPTLATVNSPLKVFDGNGSSIERAEYDPISRTIHLFQKQGSIQKEIFLNGVQVGNWLYVKGQGFYEKRIDPYLSLSEIKEDQISLALSAAKETLSKFLPIHLEKRGAKYELYFDLDRNLHIEQYVNEPKDLKRKDAHLFTPWGYIPDQGFFLLDNLLFGEVEKVVKREQVSEFINRHRVWLSEIPGFQTHLGSIESHLTYTLTDDRLKFDAELNFPESYEELYHFDEWVYIKNQGFYLKKEARGRLPLHPGLEVEKKEISSFIHNHKDELEQVQHFFNPQSPILKMGLEISLNDLEHIVVTPKMEYQPGVDLSILKRFGDYIYLPSKGFSEIPLASRLPEKYQKEVEILPHQETAFLAYEIEALKPYIIHTDLRVIKAENLRLKIRKIIPNKKKKGKEWLIDIVFIGDTGEVDLFTIWDAFQEKKKHLFSSAGLLYLKEPRFNWIRQLQAKKLDRKKQLVRLNTLEWIRLNAFESFEESKEPEVKSFLEEMNRLEVDRILDMSRLKAKLRPYQELGLQWLWFLYCHGLSGLLCDDMGLGKTHQTMALLAAVINEDEERENKYLVICPTSVIYHWQELLKKFLPELRVCTYYGLERSIEDFEGNYDLLLTSYGIIRSGKDDLRGLKFEVAIFDEIQIAKNHTSQTHKVLKTIKAQMRLGLSGTPIENRIRELKALIDLVLPSYMPIDPVFRDMFINPIEKFQDPEKKALLSRLVKPFILRRKKSDVLTDLPEKIEEIAYCDLSQEQKKLYKEVAMQMRDALYSDLKDDTKPVSFVHVFSALSTLKQICDHPALVLKEVEKYQLHESGKWDLFVELLHEARNSGQKVVVFSQYLDMLSIIESYLKKKGIGFASIKGSTRDRAEQLRKFREDPKCEVFVASLLAAGVGIDLTVASIVIHYDRWWNPAKENQATDRVHRIGQNRGVQVFKLVTKNSVEEHIHEMIERKKGLIEDIISTDDQINFLTRDELLQVFEKMFKEFS